MHTFAPAATAAPPERASGSRRANRRSGGERVLKEIQALRAIAVSMVVVFHVWPTLLPGGFLGVDVFFVISGYLIGAHLLREAEQRGRVSLTWFWVRRIRRILPAAFVVLLAALAIMLLVVPRTIWPNTLAQIAGSATYVVNWVLASQSVDYLAAGEPPTIVQHFWSLSVEEQFYIILPIVLVLTLWLLRRGGHDSTPARTRRAFAGIVIVLSIGSFGYALWLTQYAPSLAYFNTLSRAWEFGAGVSLAAITALAPRLLSGIRTHRVLGRSRVLTGIGLALIVWSALSISGDSLFPAPIGLIPVVGVLLVIIGGFESRWSIGAILGVRPVQFLGDISYSTYLWHWLFLTWFLYFAGRLPGPYAGAAVIGATLFVAWISKKFIEDPCRRAAIFNRLRWPAYTLALGGAALVVALVTVIGVVTAPKQVEQVLPSAQSECVGAAALLSGSTCDDPFGVPASVDLAAAGLDLDTDHWCLTWFDEDWRTCQLGDQLADRKGIVALVGDSYASSFTVAFDEYFRDQGLGVETFTRFGCPGLGYPNPDVAVGNMQTQEYANCRSWSEKVRDELLARPDIATVVFISRPPGHPPTAEDERLALSPTDVEKTWQSLVADGKTVIDVRTSPDLGVGKVPTCLAQHSQDPLACARDRADVMVWSPNDIALDAVGDSVTRIDMTDAFCDDQTCYSIIGGIVVYADERHVSTTYSRTVMAYLGPQVLAAIAAAE